jgi:flagellar protein FlgJ
MANKNVEQFVATYGPVAQQVSKEINVDPNVLLGQWGSESRWGQTEMAKKHHNLGGIKDFSGQGFEARDNKTGSLDKYLKFEDPEVFGMYYADQIKRNFPGAVNTGPDVGAFTRGLASGKNGSYFGVSPEEYQTSLTNAQSAISQDKQLPFEPTVTSQPKAETDMVTAPAPPPPAPAPLQSDKSGAKPGERFLGSAIGTGLGTLATGLQGFGDQRTAVAVKRAGLEEAARIAAQRAAATPAIPPGSPGVQGQGVMRQPNAPAGGGLQPPMGPADAGRMAKGQTGVIPYNTAKALGLTDIEAGQALSNTKQEGGAWDLAEKRREAMRNVQRMGGNNYVENPRFGGLLTPDQGVGGGPRASYVYQGPSELPPGQLAGPAAPPPAGTLVQLPKALPVPTTPPPPSMGAKVMSGLETVTDLFKGMLRPVASAVGTVGKYALPPLAGLSAGLDAAELANEYGKKENQRDYTKMALKGASIVGGGLSMFPPTAAVGVPLSLGATAAQAYRDDPEYYKQKMKEYTGYSP